LVYGTHSPDCGRWAYAQNMLREALFLVTAITASGCLAETAASLVSGEATAYEVHKEVQRVTLTTAQLRDLSRWLDSVKDVGVRTFTEALPANRSYRFM
jgi:hypothetical protein